MTSEVLTSADAPADEPEMATRHSSVLVWIGLFGLLAVILGALSGLVWVWATHRPAYLVRDDGTAEMTERGITEFFAAEASFVGLGLFVGVVLGVVAWAWLRPTGWRMPVIAGAGAVLSSLVCWWLGTQVGPGPLKDRLPLAKAGELVPIQHELHAWSALAVWPFAAMLPILVLAALVRDPELPPEPTRAGTTGSSAPVPRSPEPVASTIASPAAAGEPAPPVPGSAR